MEKNAMVSELTEEAIEKRAKAHDEKGLEKHATRRDAKQPSHSDASTPARHRS